MKKFCSIFLVALMAGGMVWADMAEAARRAVRPRAVAPSTTKPAKTTPAPASTQSTTPSSSAGSSVAPAAAASPSAVPSAMPPAAGQYADGRCFYLVMNDDSMEPGISAGELLLCREKAAVVSGELCVAAIECGGRGMLTAVRRYVAERDTAVLQPFNSRYAPHAVPVGSAERLRIYARVEQSIRRWDIDFRPSPRQ